MIRTLVVAAAFAAGSGAQAGEMAQADLLEALKGGGHVLYIRHAATESDYADQISAKIGDCATQRVLSEKGWAQAKAIGESIRELSIPVSSVVSSEYCRAWQTADLAFGEYHKSGDLNFEPAEEYSDAQFAKMRNKVAPMLSADVSATGNRVIVGHDDPFEAATGIYPEPQGVVFVVKPDGAGGFKVLGKIGPDDWPSS